MKSLPYFSRSFAAVLIAISFIVTVFPASATSLFCHTPRKPICLDPYIGNSTFSSEYEYDSCKQEVKRFANDWENYIECVVNGAKDEIDKAVKEFNCKAEGKSYCY